MTADRFMIPSIYNNIKLVPFFSCLRDFLKLLGNVQNFYWYCCVLVLVCYGHLFSVWNGDLFLFVRGLIEVW